MILVFQVGFCLVIDGNVMGMGSCAAKEGKRVRKRKNWGLVFFFWSENLTAKFVGFRF